MWGELHVTNSSYCNLFVYLFIYLFIYFSCLRFFNDIFSFITGEVIFNQAQPDFPPDFIFGLHDQDFVPNITEVKVLLCIKCLPQYC